ncbi:Manganese transporter SMF1 [Hyphodiscus hymeniophilus]|uniref:Manganese transporter SMF1 n=1 Tax=Hyphodiscus hymeniophilus TaxID=353542 RepID=A0A9P7AXA8_9HELO|nr:Manganese transporter SMF1 [Hyphodiscus hymeniophilus]
MNCPSRTDEPEGAGFNQNPNALAADLTTRQDLNGRANSRVRRRIVIEDIASIVEDDPGDLTERIVCKDVKGEGEGEGHGRTVTRAASNVTGPRETMDIAGGGVDAAGDYSPFREYSRKLLAVVKKFGKFVGPGFMISVAYIDPGNYSTDVAAGASYQYRLLFIVLMSNIFAIFLQSLCIKLGTVSGLNLAEACKEFLPRWLNIFLYIMAEAAIIATDIAEVIGTAIAINLLIPQIPLVAGCAISILDVLLILLFYRPNGSMKGLRAFEFFVMALVLGVVICFCIQLSLIKDTSVGEVFRGYLPSSAIVQSEGLYQACGILGATVMPHSLYLGSGIVQSRLHEFDVAAGNVAPPIATSDSEKQPYFPSLPAIKFCFKYSIAELSISLFTFALFVNSAILITAGASLYKVENAVGADLFGIHSLLSSSIAPAAGTIFALALLLSGISAGIVCTIAGQMVSEGALNWSLAPWLRRLVTRSISITPSIIIAGAVGRDGLSAALNGSQVALSVVLPFVSAPLIYFTCRNKYMTVRAPSSEVENEDDSMGVDEVLEASTGEGSPTGVKMRNHWITAVVAILVWLVITIMNIANLVLLGLGKGG